MYGWNLLDLPPLGRKFPLLELAQSTGLSSFWPNKERYGHIPVSTARIAGCRHDSNWARPEEEDEEGVIAVEEGSGEEGSNTERRKLKGQVEALSWLKSWSRLPVCVSVDDSNICTGQFAAVQQFPYVSDVIRKALHVEHCTLTVMFMLNSFREWPEHVGMARTSLAIRATIRY